MPLRILHKSRALVAISLVAGLAIATIPAAAATAAEVVTPTATTQDDGAAAQALTDAQATFTTEAAAAEKIIVAAKAYTNVPDLLQQLEAARATAATATEPAVVDAQTAIVQGLAHTANTRAVGVVKLTMGTVINDWAKAYQAAISKVSLDAEVQKVSAALKILDAEKTNAAVVVAQTQVIRDQAAAARAKLAAYDAAVPSYNAAVADWAKAYASVKGKVNVDYQVNRVASAKAAVAKVLKSNPAAIPAQTKVIKDQSAAARQKLAVYTATAKFNAAVKDANAAIASAKGKVPVPSQASAVASAKKAVASNKTNVSAINLRTKAVQTASAQVKAAVKKYNAKPAWFKDMRQRLNKVGGSWVPLNEFNGMCGKTRTVACAYSSGSISVAKSIAGWSSSRKNWVAVHELAHQYQFKIWGKLTKHPKYKSLFGSNIELLANCMASAKGYTDHGHRWQCTSQRIAWAKLIWLGKV